MATPLEHYKRAEELLAEITRDDGSVDFGDGGEAYAAAAQVHATLALAAADAGTQSAPSSAPAGYRYVESVYEGQWVLEKILPPDEYDREHFAAPPPVWWLDDGHENPGKPPLYTSQDAACAAAENQYRDDNPLGADAALEWQLTEDVETDEHGTPVGELYDMELIGEGCRTGIFVRPVRPKDGP